MKYLGFNNSTTNHVECWWQCGNSVRCYVFSFIFIRILWQSRNCQPVQKPQSKTSHSKFNQTFCSHKRYTFFYIAYHWPSHMFFFSLLIQLYTDLEILYILRCLYFSFIRFTHLRTFCFCFTFFPWNSYHSFF